MIGQTISHYRILERLGSGGMGDVFLAEDLRLHRKVALKFLRQREGCEDEERARVMREARVASSLNHPNIAVIYDVEESATEEGRAFLMAMEYVPGRTLSEYTEQEHPTLDEKLDLMEQMADAVAEAHARGIVHRDLKPTNLMVTRGRVKVLDFGLARIQPRASADAPTVSAEMDDGAEAVFAGTPHYVSPEQALGRPVDTRSDIFSLGIVFYELLAGSRPFESENLVAVIDAILHDDPPALAPRIDDARGPELDRLVAGMLARDPAARPRDLREVRAALRRLRNIDPSGEAAGLPIVAVVGFSDITPRGEERWISTGISEAVVAALQQLDGVEVWGQERFRESLLRLGVDVSGIESEDAVRLGRMTGARRVVTGRCQCIGDRIRVIVRVVDVESGHVLRAVRQDGHRDAIFDLQDRVVAELLEGFRSGDAAEPDADETHVVEAYEALSKGLLNLRAETYESLDRAVLFFERAAELDPRYTRAQVELAAAYRQKADYLTVPQLHERAIAILRRVLESHPRLAAAWREMGLALVSRGRVDEGIQHLTYATSLAPDDPTTLSGAARGFFIGKADFPRAAALFERALAHNPEAGWYLLQVAHCYALLRDFERGEPAARRAIELQEAAASGQAGVRLVGAHMRLGHLFALQGQYGAAADAFRNEIAFVGRLEHALRSRIQIELNMRLGSAHLQTGDEAGAADAFAAGLEAFTLREALGAGEPFTRYYAAAIHALSGDADAAIALLSKSAAAIPAFTRARAGIEPEWDALRDDPRFVKLIGDE